MNSLISNEPTYLSHGRLFTANIENTSNSYIDREETCIATAEDSLAIHTRYYDNNNQVFTAPMLRETTLGLEDVWLIPIKIEAEDMNTKMNIHFKVYHSSDPTKSRRAIVGNIALRLGWQVLVIKNHERRISSAEYGTVGTTSLNGTDLTWGRNGGMSYTDPVDTIEITFRNFGGTKINLGAVHWAPSGWCKSVIMWGADDVPSEIRDLMVPVIESYGWKMTFFSTAAYGNSSTKIRTSEYRDMMRNGHEVWGHNLTHMNMRTPITIKDKDAYKKQKEQHLREASKFFAASGNEIASKCMAMPFNSLDLETKVLLERLGYQLVRTGRGKAHQSWLPGIGRWNFPGIGVEVTNSWDIDSEINGVISRGQAAIVYGHNPVPGGSTSNTAPERRKFYVDHLIRWCNLVKTQEDLGKVIVTTPSKYFEMCGINLLTHPFVE